MEKTLGTLSVEEFTGLVEHTIDRRLQVWFIQLLDAVTGLQEEENAEFQPAFAASLRRSIEQARSGEGVDLKTFQKQLGQ